MASKITYITIYKMINYNVDYMADEINTTEQYNINIDLTGV